MDPLRAVNKPPRAEIQPLSRLSPTVARGVSASGEDVGVLVTLFGIRGTEEERRVGPAGAGVTAREEAREEERERDP